MNTTPVLQGRPIERATCGRTAMANRARYVWASLLTRPGKLATVAQVTDIPALAREILRTWP